MKFGLICTRCWNDDKAEVVDNCHIHFLGQDMICFECQECGAQEYLGEDVKIVWPDPKKELLKEKRKIMRELKRIKN